MLEIVGMPIWALFQKKTTWTEFRGSGSPDRGWALEVRGSGIGEETQEAADYLVAMPSRSGSVAEFYGHPSRDAIAPKAGPPGRPRSEFVCRPFERERRPTLIHDVRIRFKMLAPPSF